MLSDVGVCSQVRGQRSHCRVAKYGLDTCGAAAVEVTCHGLIWVDAQKAIERDTVEARHNLRGHAVKSVRLRRDSVVVLKEAVPFVARVIAALVQIFAVVS